MEIRMNTTNYGKIGIRRENSKEKSFHISSQWNFSAYLYLGTVIVVFGASDAIRIHSSGYYYEILKEE